MVGLRSLIAGIIQSLAILATSFIYLKVSKIYKEKQSKLLRILMNSYLLLIIGFSLATVAVFIWSFNNDNLVFANHFVGIFMEFRVGMSFVVAAFYYTYLFHQEVFTKVLNPKKNHLMLFFAFVVIIYNLVVFTGENSIFDTLGYGLIFLYLFIVFIPFTKDAIIVARKLTEPVYRKAFYSIAGSGISFLACFLFLLLDNLQKMMGGPDYSIFYFLFTLSIPIIIYSIYRGYIYPRVYAEKNPA
jgi:hypothetical protein